MCQKRLELSLPEPRWWHCLQIVLGSVLGFARLPCGCWRGSGEWLWHCRRERFCRGFSVLALRAFDAGILSVLLLPLLQQLVASLVATCLGLPCGLPLWTLGFLQAGVCGGGLRSGLGRRDLQWIMACSQHRGCIGGSFVRTEEIQERFASHAGAPAECQERCKGRSICGETRGFSRHRLELATEWCLCSVPLCSCVSLLEGAGRRSGDDSFCGPGTIPTVAAEVVPSATCASEEVTVTVHDADDFVDPSAPVVRAPGGVHDSSGAAPGVVMPVAGANLADVPVAVRPSPLRAPPRCRCAR